MSTGATVTSTSRDLDALFVKHHADDGILTAERGKHRRLFCFAAGQLIYSMSNVIEEQFEATLVELGHLDGDAAAAARRDAQSAGVKVGAYLRQLGTLEDGLLSSAMTEHALRLLQDTFEWTGGKYRFDSGRPNLADEPLGDSPLDRAAAGARSRASEEAHRRPPQDRPGRNAAQGGQ